MINNPCTFESSSSIVYVMDAVGSSCCTAQYKNFGRRNFDTFGEPKLIHQNVFWSILLKRESIVCMTIKHSPKYIIFQILTSSTIVLYSIRDLIACQILTII